MDILRRGQWWRHSRYEIKDGRILPARGATLEQYDPWALFDDRKRGQQRRPYEQLTQLIEAHWPESGWEDDMDLTAPSLLSGIVKWCEDFGALGLLYHNAETVAFPATWEVSTGRRGYSAAQTSMRRAGGAWGYAFQSVDMPEDAAGAPKGLELNQHAAAVAERRGLHPPGVTLSAEVGGKVLTQPLTLGFYRYFPGMPASNDPILPGTEAYAQWYSEPVSEFLHEAAALTWALKLRLSNPYPALALQRWLDRVGVTMRREGTTASLTWCCPSLLTQLALMAAVDLSGGSSMKQCEECRVFFVSKKKSARFCSTTCRNTALKRRYRANLASKREHNA